MKNLIYLFLILFFPISAYSQVDSTILKQQSKSEIISRYRNLLMDHIISGDKEKAKELLKYILQYNNDYYIALYSSEKWLVSFWLSDFQTILKESEKSTLLETNTEKYEMVRPDRDQLYQVIKRIISDTKDKINVEIRLTDNLSKEEKDYLQLIMEVFTSDYSSDFYQEKINESATVFVKKYPDGKFENYVRKNIRFEYAPKGFSFGMELYSGASLMNQHTGEYFKSGGVLGVGFIWGVGNFFLNTRGAFVFSGLKKDIDYKGYTWTQGQRAQVFLPELSCEYKFHPAKKISLSPVLGVGWFTVAPYQKDKEDNNDLKDIDINSKGSPLIGVDFGWEFLKRFNHSYAFNKILYGFYSCNLRYTYQPATFKATYSGMNGCTHNIFISFKMGLGGAKRVL